VVIGRDNPSLGIIRSLVQRCIPICVVDDKHSTSRFSRFTTHAIKLADVRDPDRTVETLIVARAPLRSCYVRGWCERVVARARAA
jgi:hypothetical protein